MVQARLRISDLKERERTSATREATWENYTRPSGAVAVQVPRFGYRIQKWERFCPKWSGDGCIGKRAREHKGNA